MSQTNIHNAMPKPAIKRKRMSKRRLRALLTRVHEESSAGAGSLERSTMADVAAAIGAPAPALDVLDNGVLSRDGKRTAYACADGHVRVMDVSSRTKIGDVWLSQTKAQAIAFHPDCETIVVAVGCHIMALWGKEDMSDLSHETMADIRDDDPRIIGTAYEDITCLAISASGNIVVTGCQNGAVRAYEFHRKMLAVNTSPLIDHDAAAFEIAVSDDGQVVACLFQDNVIRVNTTRGIVRFDLFDGKAQMLALSANGMRMAVASSDGCMAFIALQERDTTSMVIRSPVVEDAAAKFPHAMLFTRNNIVAVHCNDKIVRGWDWRRKHMFNHAGSRVALTVPSRSGPVHVNNGWSLRKKCKHEQFMGPVDCIALASDGKTIVYADQMH